MKFKDGEIQEVYVRRSLDPKIVDMLYPLQSYNTIGTYVEFYEDFTTSVHVIISQHVLESRDVHSKLQFQSFLPYSILGCTSLTRGILDAYLLLLLPFFSNGGTNEIMGKSGQGCSM